MAQYDFHYNTVPHSVLGMESGPQIALLWVVGKRLTYCGPDSKFRQQQVAREENEKSKREKSEIENEKTAGPDIESCARRLRAQG